MKKHLITGLTALALLGSASAAAQAQTASPSYSYAKGETRIMNETRRMDTTPTYTGREEPVQRQTQVTTQSETIYDVEPAAGYDNNPYDDFTGFYVGGDVGYSMGSVDVSDPLGPDGDLGMDGMNASAFVGYGFEHTFNWLGAYAGIEAAYEWSDASGSFAGTDFEKDEAWLITLRPGVTMHEDTLAYGIVGYSLANFESGAADEDLDGLVLGAGAQFDTQSAFKPRLEYTYTNYGDEDIGGVNFDGHENNIKLGAVFQF